MTATATIIAADPYEVTEGCYTVIAYLGGGRSTYHEGPKDFAWFTREQAVRLAARVTAARRIDLRYWTGHESPEEKWAELEASWAA